MQLKSDRKRKCDLSKINLTTDRHDTGGPENQVFYCKAYYILLLPILRAFGATVVATFAAVVVVVTAAANVCWLLL